MKCRLSDPSCLNNGVESLGKEVQEHMSEEKNVKTYNCLQLNGQDFINI